MPHLSYGGYIHACIFFYMFMECLAVTMAPRGNHGRPLSLRQSSTVEPTASAVPLTMAAHGSAAGRVMSTPTATPTAGHGITHAESRQAPRQAPC